MAAFNFSFSTFIWLYLVAVANCKSVYFPLTLTWETGAPDGNPRQLVYMNGQFPGPQLNLHLGDYVEVHVQNNLPVEATVHFHGIEQKNTPWSDGTPGVSQSPIKPGQSFTYRWVATQYGTYWYHGHARSLVTDGLYGAILIQPPSNQPSPFQLISNSGYDQETMRNAEGAARAVVVSDWSKIPSEQYFEIEQASNLDIFCVDSILVNGKGAVNCLPQQELNSLVNPNLATVLQQANLQVTDKGCTPMAIGALTEGQFPSDLSKVPYGLQSGCQATQGNQETIKVDPSSKWVSLNFISGLSSKATVVSIDEHQMWIYAVDGQYIRPQLVDTFLMYNGERYSAMVKLDKTPGNYTMRFANNLPDQLISGYATMSYVNVRSGRSGQSTPSIDYAGNPVNSSIVALDTTSLTPYNQPPPASQVDATYILSMGRYGANWQWTMNNRSTYNESLEEETPLLYSDYPSTAGPDALTIRTKNNTWIDIILQVTLGPENPAQPPHPIHKHSNKAYIIGSGNGIFSYSSVAEAMQYIPQNFNLQGAAYRDSFVTPAILPQPAWVAFRYWSSNPGAWLLHCHIQTHFSGGMALNILDGIDTWPRIPAGAGNG